MLANAAMRIERNESILYKRMWVGVIVKGRKDSEKRLDVEWGKKNKRAPGWYIPSSGIRRPSQSSKVSIVFFFKERFCGLVKNCDTSGLIKAKLLDKTFVWVTATIVLHKRVHYLYMLKLTPSRISRKAKKNHSHRRNQFVFDPPPPKKTRKPANLYFLEFHNLQVHYIA